MKISELLNEDTAYPPIPQSKTYSSDWDAGDRKEMTGVVQYIEAKGIKPKLKTVPVKQILATQDWLDFEGGQGGDPVFDEYSDHPVAVHDKDGYHLIDGHHRSSKAFMRGEDTIEVYVFEL